MLTGYSGTRTVQVHFFFLSVVWMNNEKYRSRNTSMVTSSFYRNAKATVLAFAIDNRTSFEHLKEWMQDVERFAAHISNLQEIKEEERMI